MIAQGFLENFLRIGDTALGDKFLRHADLMEFGKDGVLFAGVHLADIGDLQGQLLDFIIPQMLEDLCRNLRPQTD
ncbi:hypothetical protein D3C86_2137210 [compost metagenome]